MKQRAPSRAAAPAAKTSSCSPLTLQESAGNQNLLRLLSAGGLQPKLAVNQPGDIAEQEADRVAQEVVSGSVPAMVQRSAAGTEGPATAPPAVHEALGSTGQPLDPAARSFLEPRFNRSFGNVRVHTGERAAAAARSVEARAFTVGHNVVFGTGQYAPRTPAGRLLLAHELTHVTQQAQTGLQVQRASFFSSLIPHPIETLARAFGFGTFPPEELLAYLEELATRKAIEDDFDSDNKAREIVKLWYQGDPRFNLDTGFKNDKTQIPGPDLKTLLIEEMFAGYTSEADQKAINKILGHDPGQIEDLKAAFKRVINKDLIAGVESNMDGEELAFALHMLRPGTAVQSAVAGEGEKVAAEMEKKGTTMGWKQSFPGSGTTFERWASAPEQGETPKIGSQTIMNCWEAVLLLAFQQGAVTWRWIHDLYPYSPFNKNMPEEKKAWEEWVTKWTESLVTKLSGGLQISYRPSDRPPRIPQRGDIVLFNGVAHVALATGQRDGVGNTIVLSFWPPSEPANRNKAFNPDDPPQGRILTTTIEELKKSVKEPVVTFAKPPW